MQIGVLILFAVSFFSFAIEVDCLVDGIKSDGILRQNEKDQGNLIGSSASSSSYEDGPMYANINPFFYNIMKRSPIDRNTGRRQTGIIYGDGKPIGILQPYEESFKFMPIKEEKVYALDGGRSDLDEQEPYLNLMYPLARFARSEDALKMAEYEAARAEFLEKHYPSMLVDFKIRDKLHSNRAKSTHQDAKRDENNSGELKKSNQKRQLIVENRKAEKREIESAQPQMTQKREAENSLKQKAENYQTAETSKREAENPHSYQKDARKRETETSHQAEVNSFPKFEERQSGKLSLQKQVKKKRENGLTDAQFERLKSTISKRNSMQNVDLIENDLRGLLNDMGLIEDDLEENAEEMEKVRSVVNDEINSDESLDNPVLSKGKIETNADPDYYKSSSDRNKRTQVEPVTNEEENESKNLDAEKEEHIDKKRSVTNAPNEERRVIDVNFITKNREDKLLSAFGCEPQKNCSRASDIPNKREAPAAEASDGKDRRKAIAESKILDPGLSTTESYAQYEERVAREIKNKIQQLKEEVKRELGALEEDNDEEDEEEETLGEPQRKKRFVVNTLLDEEANNIDPNSNADSAELQPHVRRRRMLSTDMLDAAREPVNLEEGARSALKENERSDSMFSKEKFEGYQPLKEETLKALTNQDQSVKEGSLKYLAVNDDDEFNRNSWTRPHLSSKKSGEFYFPNLHKRSFLNYVPWNAAQKQSGNLNTGVYSYESESEGDSDSRTQPDRGSDMEVDRSKQKQQFKYSLQGLPNDRMAERPGYYVYYLGKNRDKNWENPRNYGMHSRVNPPTNHQPMRMVYPQFYENTNSLQKKEQYMTAPNDDENQKSMTFRITYKIPPGRRRKRQINRNFFIPFKDTEDAIVTNTFSEKYAISNNKRKNYTSSISDSPNKNIVDGSSSSSFEVKKIMPIEKGEKDFSRDDKIRFDASESNIDFTQVKSEMAIDGNRNETLYNISSREIDKVERNQYHINNKTLSQHRLESNNNSSVFKPMPTVEEVDNHQKFSSRCNNSRNKSSDDVRLNSRKILSSTINNAENAELQNFENTKYSLDSQYENERKNKSINSADRFPGSKDEHPNDMEYEDGEYLAASDVASMESTDADHIEAIRSRLENTMPSQEWLNLTDDSFETPSIGKIVARKYAKDFVKVDGDKRMVDNVSSYLLRKSVGDKLIKNSLYVPDEKYLTAEWKRRKRDARLPSQSRGNDRKKRMNWFWPIKSLSARNTAQMEEYDQFEPNEVSDSDSSEHVKDSSAGIDNNYEDLGVDVGDYDRRKRELNVFRPGFSGTNRRAQGGPGIPRGTGYFPEFRARRYADRWYKEPRRELLTDMSDVELFGALPQSYAGELSRYKRVKRGRWGRY